MGLTIFNDALPAGSRSARFAANGTMLQLETDYLNYSNLGKVCHIINPIFRAESEILDEQEQHKLLKVAKDKDVAAVILKKLAVLVSPRAMISSQDEPWLWPSGTYDEPRHRPDAFIIHPLFAQIMPNESDSAAGEITGIPSHESLFQFMNILNFVITPSSLDLSKLLDQLEAVRTATKKYHKNPSPAKGALAFKRGICLAQCDGNAFKVMEILWNAKGGADFLTSFFDEWPAAQALEQLLPAMDLQLCDKPVCCLGSGNLGSVFKVCSRAGGAAMALKVVVADVTYKLRMEYAMNLSICKEAQCVVRATKFDRTELGAGMLMDEVGLAVKPGAAWAMATAKATLAGALVALRDLHAAGYCHVSARLDNLLDCGGRIKWCDVQRAMEHKGNASLMYRDVRKSFPPPCRLRRLGQCTEDYHVGRKLLVSFGLEERREPRAKIDAYAASITMERLGALVRSAFGVVLPASESPARAAEPTSAASVTQEIMAPANGEGAGPKAAGAAFAPEHGADSQPNEPNPGSQSAALPVETKTEPGTVGQPSAAPERDQYFHEAAAGADPAESVRLAGQVNAGM